jgi:hypothetical protein
MAFAATLLRGALLGATLAAASAAASPAAAAAPAGDAEAGRKAMSGLWTGFNDRPPPPEGNSVINSRRFPPDLEAIMKPWVRAGYDKYKHAAETVVDKEPPTPDNHCLPFAIPGENASHGFGIQFLFTPKTTGLLIQLDSEWRLIHMDQQHPADLKPSFLGHSVGRWEGDTLVIDSVGFDERSQFSDGVLHSAKLHIVERYHVDEQGILQASYTYTDPDAYTAPYTKTKKFKRLDEPFQEYLNAQNNQLYGCPTAKTGSDYQPFR